MPRRATRPICAPLRSLPRRCSARRRSRSGWPCADAAAVADMPGLQLGAYVRVTIRDNGPGLNEAALDRVFDPVATPRPAAAAAAEAMRGVGGFARVESAEGIGTAVHLYFPRASKV